MVLVQYFLIHSLSETNKAQYKISGHFLATNPVQVFKEFHPQLKIAFKVSYTINYPLGPTLLFHYFKSQMFKKPAMLYKNK